MQNSKAIAVTDNDDLTWGDMARNLNTQKHQGSAVSISCSNRKCSRCSTNLAGPSDASQGISTSRSRWGKTGKPLELVLPLLEVTSAPSTRPNDGPVFSTRTITFLSLARYSAIFTCSSSL